MNKKILITGATGLIGSHLCKALADRGDELTIFTRDVKKGKDKIPFAKNYVEWNYKNPNLWSEHLNGKDAVIHFASASIGDRRWTKNYKKEILDSREISTRNLVRAIEEAKQKPKTFLCASGANYYGDSGEEDLTEDKNNGKDFLSRVCVAWEIEASKVERFGVRRVSIRQGVVLSTQASALKKMLMPYKLFIGGPIGTGKQWFPWIHIDDLVRIYLLALDNQSLTGPVNASSPSQVRMKEFAYILGKVIHRPSIFPVPKFVLKIAIGESADFITASLKVIPKKLLDAGYDFKFKDLESALKELLTSKESSR